MTTNPKRFAAPATPEPDDDAIDVQEGDDQIHELFEQWSTWCRTRRFYAPPSNIGNILGQLRGPSRPSRQPPNAKCSTSMAALHLAIKGQPEDALDAKVFWLYYGERASNIKQSAYVLGISRQHFYRLLRAFSQRVLIAAKQIEADNVAAGEALPHRAEVSDLQSEIGGAKDSDSFNTYLEFGYRSGTAKPERNIKMFRDHLSGVDTKSIASEHGISASQVRYSVYYLARIVRCHMWHVRKDESIRALSWEFKDLRQGKDLWTAALDVFLIDSKRSFEDAVQARKKGRDFLERHESFPTRSN